MNENNQRIPGLGEMYCASCGSVIPKDALFCKKCGAKVEIQNVEETRRYEGGFFSFKKLIAPALIKVFYVLGLIALIIGGIVSIVIGYRMKSSYGNINTTLIWTGIGLITLGNLFWRLFCEVWILLFNMHNMLSSIEESIKNK